MLIPGQPQPYVPSHAERGVVLELQASPLNKGKSGGGRKEQVTQDNKGSQLPHLTGGSRRRAGTLSLVPSSTPHPQLPA